jgi:hypothetical protein
MWDSRLDLRLERARRSGAISGSAPASRELGSPLELSARGEFTHSGPQPNRVFFGLKADQS